MQEKIKAAPVQPSERISELDVLRGIALFGILMVNMSFFKYPIFFERYSYNFPDGMEQFWAYMIQFIFTGKFYAIFSFLFGLGFYIFMKRAISKGVNPVLLYKRRLTALLFFGLIHLVIFWSGDILFTYALGGFLLLRFYHLPLPILKKWIIGFFLIAVAINSLFTLFQGLGEMVGGIEYEAVTLRMIEEAMVFYTEGNFGELLLYRVINEVPYVFIGLVASIPAVFGYFLCGLYAGRVDLFSNLAKQGPLFKKILARVLPQGLLLMVLHGLIEREIVVVSTLWRSTWLWVLNYGASICLFSSYIALVLLVLRSVPGRKLLAPLAAAGRMALSNYLAQTLICIFLFNGYGIGLYGQISISRGILLTVSIYLLQVFWSNAWLKYFRYGPMEWLWRTITYGKRQPIRI
ncbi:MAG: hypothetical protein AVO34_08790 [Firmicutes bacterium ML8_F2]|nr:MAG: hypothetical protein AVO34_08790 [Firmicutes bacterium ML8_F2]